MMSVSFKKIKDSMGLMNPFKDFSQDEIPLEIRYDPLTGQTTRVFDLPYRPIERPDFEAFVQRSKEMMCPFCPESLEISTPLYPKEIVPEGMNVENTIEFIKLIQDKIDLLHVSRGILTNILSNQRMIQPTYFPHGLNVPYAEKIKKAVNVPVVAVGSINMDMADKIIGEGKCDIVAMARKPAYAAPPATSVATISLVDHSTCIPNSLATGDMFPIISDEGVPG